MDVLEASLSAPDSPDERLDLSLASRFDFLTFLRSLDLEEEAKGGKEGALLSLFVSLTSSAFEESPRECFFALRCEVGDEESPTAEDSRTLSSWGVTCRSLIATRNMASCRLQMGLSGAQARELVYREDEEGGEGA